MSRGGGSTGYRHGSNLQSAIFHGHKAGIRHRTSGGACNILRFDTTVGRGFLGNFKVRRGAGLAFTKRNSLYRILKNGPNMSTRVALVRSNARKIRKTSSWPYEFSISSTLVHITHHNRYTIIDHQHPFVLALALALPLAPPLPLPLHLLSREYLIRIHPTMHTGSVSHNGEMSSVPLDIQRAGRTNRHRV